MERACGLPEIFEVVKEAVRSQQVWSRAGLLLGLADLGGSSMHMVGGLYPSTPHIIVMNRAPMTLLAKDQERYGPTASHIRLHEYLHSLGSWTRPRFESGPTNQQGDLGGGQWPP